MLIGSNPSGPESIVYLAAAAVVVWKLRELVIRVVPKGLATIIVLSDELLPDVLGGHN